MLLSSLFYLFCSSAHWFLAIICFPGLEKPVENPYIPNPVSTPLVDSSSCPTPPQPSEDGADEMETEENEVLSLPVHSLFFYILVIKTIHQHCNGKCLNLV